ncbi:MAG: hypothetical protein KGI27_09965 [Thaumarchaeota archaeon]|nr:hypothetical protein [Nitrososphaerota archaeon]
MALSDILQSIGSGIKTGGQDILQGLQQAVPVVAQMGLGGLGALGNAMQAQGNPLAFQAQQQQQMERMREAFQDKQGSELSAFQQAQLHMEDQDRQNRNAQWLAQQTQQGAIEPAQPGEDGSMEISGHFFKPTKTPTVTPPPELQDMLGKDPIPLTRLDPGMASIIGDYMKGKTGHKQAMANLPMVLKQVDSIFDPTDPETAPLNQRYSQQMQALAANGDTTRMDALLNKITDADREERMKVKQAGDIQTAQDQAGMTAARTDLPDDQLDYWYRQIKEGRIDEAQATRSMGISDKYGRRRWNEYLAKRGDPLPVALNASAQRDIRNVVSVNDSLKKLKTLLEPVKDKDTLGEDFWNRLKYSMGISGDSGGLISLGEMDRLRGTAQSLTGLRTGFNIIEQGLIHTPNFWKDSGKLMYEKVKNMSDYLDNQEDNIYKFGSKTGVVQSGKSAYFGGGTTSTQQPKAAKWIYDKDSKKVIPNPAYKE